MPIRPADDALSRAVIHEKMYFRIRDKSMTINDFNRFLYMVPGTKDKCFDWRLNWKTLQIKSTIFKIDQPKFVNRPDAISSVNYGNAKYWWIIAMANEIHDPFSEFYLGRELTIPDLNTFKHALGF